jgi:spermidine/putrescine transport system permease protein
VGLAAETAQKHKAAKQPSWSAAFTRSEALRGWTMLSPTTILMVAGLAAPLAIMVLYSFWTQNGNVVDTSLTLHNYGEVTGKYYPVLLRSLWIAALAAFCTVLLGYPVAYYVAFHAKNSKFIWLILLTIPFWTSYLLRIFALRVIMPDELRGTPSAVVIALTHAWAAFAILPIYVSLEKIDRTLLEAAADLGDGAIRRFWRITFPLSLPGVISAMTLIFVPTIGDYVTPALIGSGRPNTVMIANIIQSQIKANDWPLAAAIAIVSMVVVSMSVYFFVAALRAASRSLR